MKTVFEVVRHLWPTTLLKGLAKDAEVVPATVAGVFLVAFTVGALLGTGALLRAQDAAELAIRHHDFQAQFDEVKRLIAETRHELDCSSDDRKIESAQREVYNLGLLIERSSNEYSDELRLMNRQLSDLEEDLVNLKSAYARKCFH